MPKSAKIRKDKTADFSKAKLKLGRGKQAPTNAIDTSFKARSIALPTQSIAVEKDDSTPTTRRRLSFDDLINHVKHYSAGTRRDAISGLRELLEAHKELLDSSLTALINACVRIIGDEDASVRKGLLAFFAWILPQVPAENLAPHSDLLLLFTTSAQTHIFPEIRIDSIRFLNLFLDHIPNAAIMGWKEDSGHGSRILEGYLGILNAGMNFGETDGNVGVALRWLNEKGSLDYCAKGPTKTSTASVVLTSTSKLVVLQSLSTFLRKALASPYISTKNYINHTVMPMNTRYLAPSFTSPESYDAFDRLLQLSLQSLTNSSCCRFWQSEIDLETCDDNFVHNCAVTESTCDGHWTLKDLCDVVDVAGGIIDADASRIVDSTFIVHLARALHSTLIATFLDCAPTVFSPSVDPPETEVHLIMAVGEIVRTLYGPLLQASLSAGSHQSSADDLKVIVGYMATYFPFRASGKRNVKFEQTFQNLNVIFCELTSLLALASQIEPSIRTTRSGKSCQVHQAPSQRIGSKDKQSIQIERVSEYVIQLLRGEAAPTSQLGRSLTPVSYVALMPTIWTLLNNPTLSQGELSNSVLNATLDHAFKVTSKSALKKPTIEFVARVILLETEPQYEGNFRLGRTADEDKKVEEWVNHLPKTLWELGPHNLPVTEMILCFLLRILQRKSRLVHAEMIASFRSRLVPYFSITHALRGQIFGPYSKLPPSLRRLALDVVATIFLFEADHDLDDGLSNVVDQAVAGTEEQSYWAQLKMFVFEPLISS